MAHIIPFSGTLYDPAVVGPIRDVVAPPYDVIDATAQRGYHERHPHNVIRLELGFDEPGDNTIRNRYTRAASLLTSWVKSGALRRDSEPAVYFHTIEYQPPGATTGGAARILKGFLSTVELEAFGTGKIYPHENTRAAAKTDRLQLLEACRANLSPIFSLYSDPTGQIIQRLERAAQADKPRIDFVDDVGFRQRLWAITNPSVLSQLVQEMREKVLFIADGHHRYETALNYQRLRRQQAGEAPSSALAPYDSVLMLFAGLEDPGLTVLPTHRVLTTKVPTFKDILALLTPVYEIHEFRYQTTTERQVRRQFIDTLRQKGQAGPMFGLSVRGTDTYLILELRASHCPSASASPREKLDVSILQHQVVAKLCPTQEEQEAILYTKDDDEALDWVQRGTGAVALLLNPTRVSEVQAVASAGERMPHKSTYFFPKPLTGLVMNVMEG